MRIAPLMAAAAIRTIFASQARARCASSSRSSPACSTASFPKVQAMLRDAADDITAFAAFPVAHRKKICSTNPLERLN